MEDVSVEAVSTLPDDPTALITLTRKLRHAGREIAALTTAAHVLANHAMSERVIDDQ